MEEPYLADARSVYRTVVPRLFKMRNVVACGLGYKMSGGQRTDELCLVVSVSRKYPVSSLSPEDLIPSEIAGLPTDVVQTGRIRALLQDPKARYRPAPPGVSIGHYEITAGTFGLLVERNGTSFILSNNHVLANSNQATIGDPIYQPGPTDGGTANDRIGTLVEYAPLDYGEETGTCNIAGSIAGFLNLLAKWVKSSHRLTVVQQTDGVNLLDAALAQPDHPEDVIPQIMAIGIPSGVTDPLLGQQVQKMGRTSGLTQGSVTQIDVTVNVDYGGKTLRFAEQIFTDSMSSPGDSGSGILDMQRRAVGLLFAGSEYVTIFTPIQRVLDYFHVTLVTS